MKRVNKAILGTVVSVSFFTNVFAQDDPIVIDDPSLMIRSWLRLIMVSCLDTRVKLNRIVAG